MYKSFISTDLPAWKDPRKDNVDSIEPCLVLHTNAREPGQAIWICAGGIQDVLDGLGAYIFMFVCMSL